MSKITEEEIKKILPKNKDYLDNTLSDLFITSNLTNEIKLKIVHPKNNNFYESCREKLGWSLDITNTKPS